MKTLIPYAEVCTVRSLEQCETAIEKGLQSYLEVAAALREIRDCKLYQGTYDNFEQYCRTRWGWGRHKVITDIEAADYVEKRLVDGNQQTFSKTQALTAARDERRQINDELAANENRLRELRPDAPVMEFTSEPRQKSTLAEVLNYTPPETAYAFVALVTKDELRLAYRAAAKRLHPDRAGDAVQMAELNRLWENLEQTIYKGESK